MTTPNPLSSLLLHHVTGAIERGEKEPITEISPITTEQQNNASITSASIDMDSIITTTPDELGTWNYQFQFEGKTHKCFDFQSHKEAVEGAQSHLRCLINGWPHEVADGLGAIYRG